MCDTGCIITHLRLRKKIYIDDNELSSDHSSDGYDDGVSESDTIHIPNENLKCYSIVINEKYENLNHAVMKYAVSKGHIDCIKSLHSLHALWNTDIAEIAIETGHFECFKYIIENMAIEENCKIIIRRKILDRALQIDEFSDYINNNMQNIKKYIEKKRYA
jgi:hypothetical protein